MSDKEQGISFHLCSAYFIWGLICMPGCQASFFVLRKVISLSSDVRRVLNICRCVPEIAQRHGSGGLPGDLHPFVLEARVRGRDWDRGQYEDGQWWMQPLLGPPLNGHGAQGDSEGHPIMGTCFICDIVTTLPQSTSASSRDTTKKHWHALVDSAASHLGIKPTATESKEQNEKPADRSRRSQPTRRQRYFTTPTRANITPGRACREPPVQQHWLVGVRDSKLAALHQRAGKEEDEHPEPDGGDRAPAPRSS